MTFRSKSEHASPWPYILVVVCALPLVACGDDSSDHSDAGDEHTGHTGDGDGDGDGDHSAHEGDAGDVAMCGLAANCTGDELTPTAGDEIAGHMGNFTAMLHEAADYGTGEGTQVTADWVVMLEDAGGNAVTDATVMVKTWSVDCMHDGPTAPVEVTANADGNYEIPSVYAHGGPWETRLMVASGGTEDMIHISVCAPGEEHGGTHGG